MPRLDEQLEASATPKPRRKQPVPPPPSPLAPSFKPTPTVQRVDPGVSARPVLAAPKLPTPTPGPTPTTPQHSYGPPSPPPKKPTPKPYQKPYEDKDSTGPQHRRFEGSHDLQKEIDETPPLSVILNDPYINSLPAKERAAAKKSIAQEYHNTITVNRSNYKADATKAGFGDDRAFDRNAQRNARAFPDKNGHNRNVQVVRQDMGGEHLPEYARDVRPTSQSAASNVAGNVLNNTAIGQAWEAQTGEAPFRTREAQGYGEQGAEMALGLGADLATFYGAGGVMGRGVGAGTRAVGSRLLNPAGRTANTAMRNFSRDMAGELVEPIAKGASELATMTGGQLAVNTPRITNQVRHGELTPKEGLKAIGATALTGAAMAAAGMRMPGNAGRQIVRRNLTQTGIGAFDQLAQGQAPTPESLMFDAGAGLAGDAMAGHFERKQQARQPQSRLDVETGGEDLLRDDPAERARLDAVGDETRRANEAMRGMSQGETPEQRLQEARFRYIDAFHAAQDNPNSEQHRLELNAARDALAWHSSEVSHQANLDEMRRLDVETPPDPVMEMYRSRIEQARDAYAQAVVDGDQAGMRAAQQDLHWAQFEADQYRHNQQGEAELNDMRRRTNEILDQPNQPDRQPASHIEMGETPVQPHQQPTGPELYARSLLDIYSREQLRDLFQQYPNDRNLYFALHPDHDFTLGGPTREQLEGINRLRRHVDTDFTDGYLEITGNEAPVQAGDRPRMVDSGRQRRATEDRIRSLEPDNPPVNPAEGRTPEQRYAMEQRLRALENAYPRNPEPEHPAAGRTPEQRAEMERRFRALEMGDLSNHPQGNLPPRRPLPDYPTWINQAYLDDLNAQRQVPPERPRPVEEPPQQPPQAPQPRSRNFVRQPEPDDLAAWENQMQGWEEEVARQPEPPQVLPQQVPPPQQPPQAPPRPQPTPEPAPEPENTVRANPMRSSSSYQVGQRFNLGDLGMTEIVEVRPDGELIVRAEDGTESRIHPAMLDFVRQANGDSPDAPPPGGANPPAPPTGGPGGRRGGGPLQHPSRRTQEGAIDLAVMGKLAAKALGIAASPLRWGLKAYDTFYRLLADGAARQYGWKVEYDGKEYKLSPGSGKTTWLGKTITALPRAFIGAMKGLKWMIGKAFVNKHWNVRLTNWWQDVVTPAAEGLEAIAKRGKDWFKEKFDDSDWMKSPGYQLYQDALLAGERIKEASTRILQELMRYGPDELVLIERVLDGGVTNAQWQLIPQAFRDHIVDIATQMFDVGMLSQHDMDLITQNNGIGDWLGKEFADLKGNTFLNNQIEKMFHGAAMHIDNMLTKGFWVAADPDPRGPLNPANLRQVGTSKLGHPIYEVPTRQAISNLDGTQRIETVMQHMELHNNHYYRPWEKNEARMHREGKRAAYKVARLLMKMSHDVERGTFLKSVSEDPNLSVNRRGLTEAQIKDLKDNKGWKLLPAQAMGRNGRLLHYGQLSHHWVAPEIYQYLINQDMQQSTGLSAIRPLMTAFKIAKTALAPRGHVNNTVNNFMLYDANDGNWKHVGEAASYLAGSKDPALRAHFQAAKENLAFGGTVVQAELKGYRSRAIQMATGVRSPLHFDPRAILDPMTLPRMLGRFTRFVVEKAEALYGHEDDVFRFALYLDRVNKGATPAEAAKAAREAFVNYDIHAPYIQVMKNTTHPFISYSYRMLPQLARIIKQKPWKVASQASLWATINFAMSAANQAMAPEGASTEAEERAAKGWDFPGYRGITDPVGNVKRFAQETMADPWDAAKRAGNAISHVRTPFRDSKGNSMYWGIENATPLGIVADNSAQPGTGLPLPNFLNPSGPYVAPIEAFGFNKDRFNGKEIRNQYEPWTRQAKDLAIYFGKQFEPGMIQHLRKLMPGSQYDWKSGAANQFMNAPSVDIKQERRMNRSKYEHDKREHERVLGQERWKKQHKRANEFDDVRQEQRDEMKKKRERYKAYRKRLRESKGQ